MASRNRNNQRNIAAMKTIEKHREKLMAAAASAMAKRHHVA